VGWLQQPNSTPYQKPVPLPPTPSEFSGLGVLKRQGDYASISAHLRSLGENPSFEDAAGLLSAFVADKEATSLRLWHETNPPAQEPVKHISSIGLHCLTSFTLKKFNLKAYSGPFDWIFSNFPMVTHCIEDNFDIFLDKRYFEPIPLHMRQAENVMFCDHAFYRDKFGARHVFNHYDVTLAENYNYYVRCVDRFRAALTSGQRNLLVGMSYDIYMSDTYFPRLCSLMEKFPGSELLIISTKMSDGTKFGAQLADERGPHKLFELYMTGTLGPLQFTHSADEVTFRRLLDNYRFDLEPARVGYGMRRIGTG
jgi:hypothetical protein